MEQTTLKFRTRRLAPNEELFPDAPAPAPAASRLTQTRCRVCPNFVAVDAPARLCAHCLADVAATTAHVWQTNTSADAAWLAAQAQVDDATREKFDAIQARRDTLAPAVFAKKWQLTIAAGGALGALLTAYDVYDRVLVWADAALREIELAEAVYANA